LLSSYTPTLNRTALEKVKIPLISEIDWYANQALPKFTTGTRTQGDGASTGSQDTTGTQNVNYKDVKGSAGVAGMTQNYTMSMTTGQTVTAGEVFTISGVYAWDWRTQQSTGFLAQFTVLANATAAASAVTLSIQPPLIVQGTSDGTATNPTAANTAFATVDSIPAINSYIKFAGALSTSLTVRSAFNKRAISMVSARLQMPFTGVASYAVDPDTGIALRYWRGSDIVSGSHIHRWDCMYGATVLDSYLGTKVCGT
jgi:hypothetical protein